MDIHTRFFWVPLGRHDQGHWFIHLISGRNLIAQTNKRYLPFKTWKKKSKGRFIRTKEKSIRIDGPNLGHENHPTQ